MNRQSYDSRRELLAVSTLASSSYTFLNGETILYYERYTRMYLSVCPTCNHDALFFTNGMYATIECPNSHILAVSYNRLEDRIYLNHRNMVEEVVRKWESKVFDFEMEDVERMEL